MPLYSPSVSWSPCLCSLQRIYFRQHSSSWNTSYAMEPYLVRSLHRVKATELTLMTDNMNKQLRFIIHQYPAQPKTGFSWFSLSQTSMTYTVKTLPNVQSHPSCLARPFWGPYLQNCSCGSHHSISPWWQLHHGFTAAPQLSASPVTHTMCIGVDALFSWEMWVFRGVLLLAMIFQHLAATVYLDFNTTSILKRLRSQVQGQIDRELQITS